jgi:hypothetical protein
LVRCLFISHQNFLIVVYCLLSGLGEIKNDFANMCREKINLSEVKNYNHHLASNNIALGKEIISYSGSFKLPNEGLVYLNSCLDKGVENLNITDIRDYIYNEMLLSNLVKIKHLNNLNSTGGLNYKESFVGTNPKQTIIEQDLEESYPYLKYQNTKKYTLVLDLDETLVHYMEEDGAAFVQIRPFTEIFLDTMAKYYEVVIFTAALSDVRF